ncbi:GNAT family N-acetyltransferase [Mucilaginibacter sp. Bleaf8]|uniref:GNAT family N-acetyltransferase n=1 Tax=Mucilaginibacter sp. Bleaf8 TaxID=2834430 RepID=UPI001BCE7BB9|nr:GNAT family N-acetyltransferase [Mucilaginibacter sp. Bleaf8]MBS7564683.1 GNAT family N-acetyltransferase [Mucilaginibacter sp. Bleaf8]
MNIRKANHQDIEPIMQLIREAVSLMQAAGNQQWDASYPNADIFTQDINAGYLWIAEIDSVVAGVIAVTDKQEEEYGQIPGWDITERAIVAHRLAVSPHHRGKGLAAALLQQCEVVAREQHIELLRLDTNTLNRPMQNLFMKLGYHMAGEITLHNRPDQQFLAFEKRL